MSSSDNQGTVTTPAAEQPVPSSIGVTTGKYAGEASSTDMGYGNQMDGKTWPYTIISEELFDSEYKRLGRFATFAGGRADSTTFQPFDAAKNQDRHAVQEWKMKDGTWTFAAVFDGHGGDHAVEYVVEALPGELKGRLSSLVSFIAPGTLQEHAVGTLMQETITAVDDRIRDDLLNLFPGGASQIDKMSDDNIKSLINDKERGATNIMKVLRARHGTTALIALQDPSKKNLWIAGLGDCSAILALKGPAGEWKGELVTEVHNGLDEGEKARVRQEHPNEEECIMGFRVIGAIMVTRAIGDFAFKLPRAYVERVFLNGDPTYVVPVEKLRPWIARIFTPPYVSNKAAIHHRRIEQGTETVLVLASDGLTDLLSPANPALTPELIDSVGRHIGRHVEAKEQLSLSADLVKFAMGGSDMTTSSRYLTVDMDGEAWMDDTTVVCVRL